MDGLPVRSRSAEDYGTLLTAELERAMVLGDSVLGVCVDQSKAYDSVRLDLLEFLLEGSGMPKAVWQPMADMARAPRRLKVRSATRGNPPVGSPPAARLRPSSWTCCLNGVGEECAAAARRRPSGVGSTTAQPRAEARPQASRCGPLPPAVLRTSSKEAEAE